MPSLVAQLMVWEKFAVKHTHEQRFSIYESEKIRKTIEFPSEVVYFTVFCSLNYNNQD